ncbi:D-xylose ABC transporter substrate-binding protein [Paenibacillus frigoriresistens]|uniref:D-xylose ABC transporter substrate-binding protein n=1 Tax=Paenibacillus alginolyticus TaxID=59839 RepID=UPI001566FF19|nr:D-xylose ABC transporter substrate-binding protein [Paenibacillus frigoriresistens]NRF92349.1 D-xylose ABC transporter substrate-binding protein [Paenibacillus frigoriresistens]
MKRWMKNSGIATAAMVVAVSLTACGGSKPSSGTEASAPAKAAETAAPTAAAAAATKAPSKEGKKIVIGLSMDTLQEERWQKDRDIFVEEAKKLGAEVNVQSANSDDAKQISQAENLISQGVNVLVVIPHNADASAAIVEKAHAAGIKVLSYDRLITNSDLDIYLSFDNEKVGEMQAKAIVEKAPKGKYVLIEGADTDNNAHLFQKGQMNILDPLVKKGDIQIVFNQWSKDWNPAAALANMENALTANKNQIDAVVAANDGTAGGAIQALTAQGLAGKIPVSGQDAELAAAQRIVEGTQTMTVYKPIKKLATKAAEIAIKMAKGEDTGADKKVNNKKMDVPSILLEPIAVNKDNIDSTVIADGFQKKEDVYKNVKK